MITSTVLRSTRKRFDERLTAARERNAERIRSKRPKAELELFDAGAELLDALYESAGGVAGYLNQERAEALLESITSPLWCDYVKAFDQLPALSELTADQWKKVRELGLQAQKEGPLRQWLGAARTFEEVQSVLTRAVARAVKEERENG